jgi:protein disulfide-isomerase
VKKALVFLLLASAGSAYAATIGDTYAQVVAEKGPPVGTINAGSVQVLNYPDAVIKVTDGVVVSVRPQGKSPPTVVRQVADASPRAAAVPVAYDGPAVWETDYAAAVDQARARKCHVLILYTGSDWCSWCHKMEAEVYSQPEFARYSHEKFVLLKLDYPRHMPQPDEIRNQNAELQRRYNVRGYPTVVLADAKGNALGRIDGYQPGGPGHFIQMLQAFE